MTKCTDKTGRERRYFSVSLAACGLGFALADVAMMLAAGCSTQTAISLLVIGLFFSGALMAFVSRGGHFSVAHHLKLKPLWFPLSLGAIALVLASLFVPASTLAAIAIVVAVSSFLAAAVTVLLRPTPAEPERPLSAEAAAY